MAMSFEVCAACGANPAVNIKLQSASSRIIWWNYTKIEKPLCAPCAEMMYLKMQERTLTQGWWGPLSAVATLVFSIGNRIRIGNHRKVLPTMAIDETSAIRLRLQVRRRPAALVLSALAIMIIIALVGNAITAPTPINDSTPASYVGSCWSEVSGSTQLQQVQCSDATAIYEVYQITDYVQNCPNSYITAGIKFACLQKRI